MFHNCELKISTIADRGQIHPYCSIDADGSLLFWNACEAIETQALTWMAKVGGFDRFACHAPRCPGISPGWRWARPSRDDSACTCQRRRGDRI